MANCPICGERQPRIFNAAFDCSRCETELKVAGSTLAWMILAPVVVLVAALILLKPMIGRGGVIVLGLISGHVLPWICFVLFYKVEPTGHFDLSEARGVEKSDSWTRQVRP